MFERGGFVRTNSRRVAAAAVLTIGLNAAARGAMTDPGYNPDKIGSCKPHFTSDEIVTIEQANDVMNRYAQVPGEYLDDAAQADSLPFQKDEISGIGEVVCTVALAGDVLHLTTTGSEIAHDPAFTAAG